jgi:dihydrofolate reductase
MRKVVLGLSISIDGYIARLDSAVDFLFMPKDYSMARFFATVDAAIMGRKTLEDALKMGGSSGGSSMKTYVFSRSKPPGAEKHIWLMGGGELARDFLKADSVDELYIGMVPVLLG